VYLGVGAGVYLGVGAGVYLGVGAGVYLGVGAGVYLGVGALKAQQQPQCIANNLRAEAHMDEPLLADRADEVLQSEHLPDAKSFKPSPSCLPLAWTSIPADLNAPGKLLGSIGLEWM
jgi:hypothetical protein